MKKAISSVAIVVGAASLAGVLDYAPRARVILRDDPTAAAARDDRGRDARGWWASAYFSASPTSGHLIIWLSGQLIWSE
jgi:hypothetical protein